MQVRTLPEIERLAVPQTCYRKYAAISYTWGPNPKYAKASHSTPAPADPYTRLVHVNGRPFRIRVNLWNLLYHLRQRGESRFLWVDALCIDQENLEERNFHVLDILIDLTRKMVEGELIQLAKIGRIDVTEDDALRLATYKTACLFSGCARLGAVLGGLEGKEEQALADYGRYAGLAFQLVDDLLDFTASAEQLGKPVLSDLKEGKVTLPLIYAMENGHRDARELVARVLEEKEFNSVRPETIVSLVHESGALGRARNLAQDFAHRAKACLNGHQDSEYARALATLPDFILEREN